MSLWRVTMTAGQAGPVHAFDVEQFWLATAGSPSVEVDGELFALQPGDLLQIPAHALRQVRACGGAAFLVCGSGTGQVTRPDAPDAEPVRPPWVA